MKRPIEFVLHELALRNPNIFVWVIMEADKSKIQSMRIGFTEAVQWCLECAKKYDGEVPAFLMDKNTIFLGWAPVA